MLALLPISQTLKEKKNAKELGENHFLVQNPIN